MAVHPQLRHGIFHRQIGGRNDCRFNSCNVFHLGAGVKGTQKESNSRSSAVNYFLVIRVQVFVSSASCMLPCLHQLHSGFATFRVEVRARRAARHGLFFIFVFLSWCMWCMQVCVFVYACCEDRDEDSWHVQKAHVRYSPGWRIGENRCFKKECAVITSRESKNDGIICDINQ